MATATLLNFCAKCGARRIREVKTQLQELFDGKEYQEDTCAICRKKLTVRNKCLSKRSVVKKGKFEKKTVGRKVEYEFGSCDDDDDDNDDDSGNFFDSLNDDNINEQASEIPNKSELSQDSLHIIKEEPSTSNVTKRMTRLRTGAIMAKELKNLPDNENTDDSDDDMFDGDHSDSADSNWEPLLDAEINPVSKSKTNIKSKKIKLDISNNVADALKECPPKGLIDTLSVAIKKEKTAGNVDESIAGQVVTNQEDEDTTSEELGRKERDESHVTKAYIETQALAPEVLSVMGKITDDEKPYNCKFCDKKPFASVALFIKHISTKHAAKIKSSIAEPYQCKTCCEMKFREIRQWMAHTKYKPFKCVYPNCCAAFSVRWNLVEHEMIHKGVKPFSCELCDMSFYRQNILKKHVIVVHDKIKRFVCQTCGVRFGTSNTLQVHTRTHTKERPFKCEVCHRAFKSKHQLQCHKYDHTGNYPFVCEICGHGLKSKYDFKCHLATHSGEKPWLCQQCGQSFTKRMSMINHQRTIHNGEKTFKCRFCPMQFGYGATRVQHEKTHPEWTGVRKFVCETCGFDCQSRQKLKLHSRGHSGEKPYHCQLCSFSCNRDSNLRTHMRRHTGEKPYRCKHCDMRFMYFEPYKKHKQICNVDLGGQGVKDDVLLEED